MNQLLDGLFLYEIVLLFLGIFLFIILVLALLFYVFKNRPIKSLALFFPLPIVMIGFPGIQSFQLGNDLLTLEKEKQYITENPTDSVAKAALSNRLQSLEGRPIEDPEVLTRIAEAQAVVGDSVKALEISEKILGKYPESPKIQRLKDKLSTPSVKLDQGITKLQKDPENSQAKELLARNLANIESSSNYINPYVSYQAARAHLALGDTAQAVMRLDSMVMHYPNNRAAIKLKEKITRNRTP